MKFKATIIAGATGLAIAATAYAASHSPIAQRQAAMKVVGGQMRTLGGMAQGKVAYDDLAALSALEIMRTAVAESVPLFANSDNMGEDTRALPAIWAADSDFEAGMGQLLASIDAAIAAEPADSAAFAPLFGAVAGTCKSCHEKYRAPED